MSRQHTTYSETHILGTMLLAIREGVVEAARLTNTPEQTIYSWFKARGGLTEIRNFITNQAEEALSIAEKAVYEEVARRMAIRNGHKVSDGDVLLAFRTLIEARLNGEQGQAQAGAQANVWNINVNE